jgi:nicotinamidase-related amidase
MDPTNQSLIEAGDSLLLVVDVQPVFLDKLPPADRRRLVINVCWLIRLAAWAGVPVVATAEEATHHPMDADVFDALPRGTALFDKAVFGLADQPDIAEAVRATGRGTAVLVGLETDVCILHSALGLLDRGHRVVVVADAVASPAPHHELALARLRAAGATLVDRKGLFYEWLRTVAEVERFHRELPDMRALVDDDL